MIDRTINGRAFKILNIIDEFTRECLAILVARKIKTQDVIDLLFHPFIFRGAGQITMSSLRNTQEISYLEYILLLHTVLSKQLRSTLVQRVYQ